MDAMELLMVLCDCTVMVAVHVAAADMYDRQTVASKLIVWQVDKVRSDTLFSVCFCVLTE